MFTNERFENSQSWTILYVFVSQQNHDLTQIAHKYTNHFPQKQIDKWEKTPISNRNTMTATTRKDGHFFDVFVSS
jgi:intein-encoded DNA endonuclease-like protein